MVPGPFAVAPPSCAAEALAMVEAAYDFLNSDDLPSLPVTAQAECLRMWSRADAKGAAARASLLGAFNACDGPRADGQRSTGAWLTRFTRATPAAARRQASATRRLRSRPHVHAALIDGAISVSYGEWIGDAVAAFYPEDQDAVEQILVEAAVSGASVEDLANIATVALRKLRPGGTERDEAQRFTDRGLTLSKTLGGVGRLNADLTAEATSLTETVIEALAVKKGPEDTRTKRQRRHDALAEAMRRLVDSDLMPERGGAKPHLRLDMDLATLRSLPGAEHLEDEWVEQQVTALARRRLRGRQTVRELLIDQPEQELPPGLAPPDDQACAPGSPGATSSAQGAFLAGVGPISDRLAAALSCDSIITPTVLGAVDHDALNAMTAEWLAAMGLLNCDPLDALKAPDDRDGIGRDGTGRRDGTGHDGRNTQGEGIAHSDSGPRADRRHGGGIADGHPGSPCGRPPDEDLGVHGDGDHGIRGVHGDGDHGTPAETLVRLRRSMLRWAIRVLSGPNGLASYLRTGLLEAPLSGPAIVLDAGTDGRTVPAPLERLVRRRDRRCRFPGCDHPAELSQVHHIVPRSRGGPTELWNLLTLCAMHHLIAVHTWGWEVRLDPGGTTCATGPDGRVLYEHDRPGEPPLHAA
ncbi:HNH endonuclease signature motif containing protein [Actinomadura alba]|uniref:DUF222 domain-containing protein n=1 Tax=Actinomadura alba TaxID=406431 RepID=A0ABR7LTH5_9ACTN|nr:HNH endonuclease signature motif containing protein [Actinomadura alba]MBC6467698.1 DUF222 domain-containing protein [Actinomadura alba]